MSEFTFAAQKSGRLVAYSQSAAKPFVRRYLAYPPENLADYIAEFRALLDQHQLQYGVTGHVDAGVLHVRPALDLCDKEQVLRFKQISDQIAELTRKYGRINLGANMAKECAHNMAKNSLPGTMARVRYIKSLFDPQNQLNRKNLHRT